MPSSLEHINLEISFTLNELPMLIQSYVRKVNSQCHLHSWWNMQIRLLKELMPHHSCQKRQVSGLKETQEDNIGGEQPCLVVALCVC